MRPINLSPKREVKFLDNRVFTVEHICSVIEAFPNVEKAFYSISPGEFEEKFNCLLSPFGYYMRKNGVVEEIQRLINFITPINIPVRVGEIRPYFPQNGYMNIMDSFGGEMDEMTDVKNSFGVELKRQIKEDHETS